MLHLLVALGQLGFVVSIIVRVLMSDQTIEVVVCNVRAGTIALVLLLNLLPTVVEPPVSCITHQFDLTTVFSILLSILL